MKPNPVGWFEIYVQDISRAQKFYEAVLDCTLSPLSTEHMPEIQMRAFNMDGKNYGASGALVHMPGCPSGGMGTLVYFSSDDCAIEAGRIIENGGRLEKPKFSIGEYGFIALGIDTEGNMFGLHSMA